MIFKKYRKRKSEEQIAALLAKAETERECLKVKHFQFEEAALILTVTKLARLQKRHEILFG